MRILVLAGILMARLVLEYTPDEDAWSDKLHAEAYMIEQLEAIQPVCHE